MKKFWSEFKAFIAKGNIIDLAVAIVIGNAFNKIVSSLVNDIIMPLVSLMVGGASVADWKWVICEAQYDSLGNIIKAESALMYGTFIQAIIDFLIIALTIFIMIKVFNASRKGLDQLGHSVIAESKKTWKKLRRRNNKNAEQVAVLSVETNAVADSNSSTQTAEANTQAELSTSEQTSRDEKATEVEVSPAQASPTEVNKDEELLAVLKEIRDYMKVQK